jgi:iron complex transport system permease protein
VHGLRPWVYREISKPPVVGKECCTGLFAFPFLLREGIFIGERMTAITEKIWRRPSGAATTWVLCLLLLAFMLACLCIGKYTLSPQNCLGMLWQSITGGLHNGTWTDMDKNILFGVRLPRVFATVIVGGALALSGSVYQSIFKNPLVSPDLLGVSAGACIGAAVAILASLPSIGIQAAAFVGGIVAVTLTVMIPRIMKSQSNIMLVLAGIIVGGAMSSILGFIKYVADPETQLAAITYWQLGSFSYVNMGTLMSILPLTILAAGLLLAMSFWIGVLSLGEREAQTLGANVRLLRGTCIGCATILTASAVCISGTIGWVGLIIPHFSRMLVGTDHRKLLPASVLVGGIFMLLVDTITRMIGPAEMPISILTGFVGAPFYAWLLYKQRSRLR